MSTSNFRYVGLNKNKTNHFPHGAKPCIPTTPFKAWSGGSVVAATKKTSGLRLSQQRRISKKTLKRHRKQTKTMSK
jgi:hypothetical protein